MERRQLDLWTRLDRFLLLGADRGTYYAGGEAPAGDRLSLIRACLAQDGPKTVRRIVRFAESERGPALEPALCSLAACAKFGDLQTRRAAQHAVPRVCRKSKHIMRLAAALDGHGGWGRGTRRAIARWYTETPPEQLVRQAIEQPEEAGWHHRDLLRLAHPRARTSERNGIFHWLTRGSLPTGRAPEGAARILWAHDAVRAAKRSQDVVSLISAFSLGPAALPERWLVEPAVWAALLPELPLAALLEHLPTMTRVGLLLPGARETAEVVRALEDEAAIRASGLHPMELLRVAGRYEAGHDAQTGRNWYPVDEVLGALRAAFHRALPSAAAIGRRSLFAIDVSRSMTWGEISSGVSPWQASLALAMAQRSVNREASFYAIAPDALRPLSLPSSLDAARRPEGPAGRADPAEVIERAMGASMRVDTFVVLTDHPTGTGARVQAALARYRARFDPSVQLITVGMISSGFSIAGPEEMGVLDVVGFDAQCARLIESFAAPELV